MLVIPAGLAPSGWETTYTPSAQDGVTVTGSGTAHTKGSYSQLIASTLKPAYGLIVKMTGVSSSGDDTAMLLDIAIGAASSEIIIAPDLNAYGADGTSSAYGGKYFYVPIFIPAGSRLSARCASVVTSATVGVDVWPLFGGALYTHAGPINAYGVVSGSSRGTDITPGSDAWGSWTQIVASTLRDHRLFFFGYGAAGDTSITSSSLPMGIQLAVGAAASEVLIGEALFMSFRTNEVAGAPYPNLIHTPIPSGTRLAVRMFGSSGTEARDVIVYGVS